MSESSHEKFLRDRIEAILPGSYVDLERLDSMPDRQARLIVSTILSFACDAQNIMAITAGRYAFARLPPTWLSRNFMSVASTTIDFEDEWQYRRLLELLEGAGSREKSSCVAIGLASNDPEIVAAADEFLDLKK